MTPAHRIPGTRFGAERRRDLFGVTAAAAWLLGPAAWLARARARRGEARLAEKRWARSAARRLAIDLRISGLEHIDSTVRYVVAPLHEGFADVIALLHLPLRPRFVARAELTEWSVLGGALRAGDHLVVDPEAPVPAYRRLLRSADSLANDDLVIFPQGTILGIESAFNQGAFRLAEVLERPVLPIVMAGSHRVWEHPFSPLVRFGQTIRVEVLEAIPADRAVAEARTLEQRMKRRALDLSPGPRRFDPERDGWWDDYRYEIDPDFDELAARVAEHRRGRGYEDPRSR